MSGRFSLWREETLSSAVPVFVTAGGTELLQMSPLLLVGKVVDFITPARFKEDQKVVGRKIDTTQGSFPIKEYGVNRMSMDELASRESSEEVEEVRIYAGRDLEVLVRNYEPSFEVGDMTWREIVALIMLNDPQLRVDDAIQLLDLSGRSFEEFVQDLKREPVEVCDGPPL